MNGLSKNQSSTMLEGCEASFFIDPEDGEVKETIKNARKQLEILVEAAMLCKMGAKKHLKLRETASESDESNKIQKRKHACIVEAHEST